MYSTHLPKKKSMQHSSRVCARAHGQRSKFAMETFLSLAVCSVHTSSSHTTYKRHAPQSQPRFTVPIMTHPGLEAFQTNATSCDTWSPWQFSYLRFSGWLFFHDPELPHAHAHSLHVFMREDVSGRRRYGIITSCQRHRQAGNARLIMLGIYFGHRRWWPELFP